LGVVVPEFQASPEELPPPSAELVLFRVHVEAMVATMGRKRAERYLRAMAEKLAWEEGLASVFHIRPIAQHAEVRRTRQQASAIFERMLPVFLAAIPPK
jgi:hypothetical protein